MLLFSSILDFFRFHRQKMQVGDEFTPSTTEPVFGSGLISQTKSQLSTNNDISDNDKVIPSSESIINGQNDKITSNENITNGTIDTTSENASAGDSSVVHVNGQNEKTNEVPPVEHTTPASEASVTEKLSQVELTVPSTEPAPVLSTPVDTVNEGSSSAATTTVDTVPPPAVVVEPPTTIADDNIPEAPVATESEAAETKSKVKKMKLSYFCLNFILK